jgi:tetraacyldisaccharide 4'-kinase
MSVLRLLLLPFAVIYDGITRLRNRMYDTGWKPSVSFDLPVICIGNLAMGGAGKTPMVEYTIRLLRSTHKVATLSRGYGRSTKGLRVAGKSDTALTIGDEPYQLFTKFGDQVAVTVCEDRAFAIPHILDQFPETKVVLLDDAFQHRRLKSGLSILLTEYQRPFYKDYVLPYGRLREHSKGADRSDVIVVTKCPNGMSDEEMNSITSRVREIADKPVFFSTIRYGEPQPMQSMVTVCTKRVVLVSGIANHAPLQDHVSKNFDLMRHFAFRDHHRYTSRDLKLLEEFAGRQGTISILTTEKDRAKLEGMQFRDRLSRLPVFYIPIEMEFIRNGKEFDALVRDFVVRG